MKGLALLFSLMVVSGVDAACSISDSISEPIGACTKTDPRKIELTFDMDSSFDYSVYGLHLKIEAPNSMERMGVVSTLSLAGFLEDGGRVRRFIAETPTLLVAPNAVPSGVGWGDTPFVNKGLIDAKIKHDLADGNGYVDLPGSSTFKFQGAAFRVSYNKDLLDDRTLKVAFNTTGDGGSSTPLVYDADGVSVTLKNGSGAADQIKIYFDFDCKKYKSNPNDALANLTRDGNCDSLVKPNQVGNYGHYTFETGGSDHRSFVVILNPKTLIRGGASEPKMGVYKNNLGMTFQVS